MISATWLSVGDRVTRFSSPKEIGEVIEVDNNTRRARVQWKRNKTWYKINSLVLVKNAPKPFEVGDRVVDKRHRSQGNIGTIQGMNEREVGQVTYQWLLVKWDNAEPDEVLEFQIEHAQEPRDLVAEIKEAIAQQLEDQPPALPTGKHYQTIVIDPPWQYQLRDDDPSHRARCPYPAMTLDQMKELPIPDLADRDAVLWLWTTNNHMGEAFELIRFWGMTHKTIMTWIKTTNDGAKVRIGTGHWLRNATEHCLIATKGNPRSHKDLLQGHHTTAFFGPRREHSRKPENFYQFVEELSPDCDRLEMFARESRAGWDSWGGEVGKFDLIPDQYIEEEV